MKDKKGFIEFLRTLICSWGGDTPPEAIWAANDLIKWVEKEFDVVIGINLNEENPQIDQLIEKIESL